jgi:hypothetical protein
VANLFGWRYLDDYALDTEITPADALSMSKRSMSPLTPIIILLALLALAAILKALHITRLR